MATEGYNDRQLTLIAVVSLCAILCTLATALRFVTRRLTAANLGWDDWCAFVAMIFSWITNIFTYISIRAGLGQHIDKLTPDDLTLFGLSFWLQELSWTIAMGFVVFSILMFYKRLFPIKVWLRRSVYVMLVFTICWAISTFLVLVFQCTPVPFFWNRQLPGGHCIEGPVFYFTNGTISMITVFVVLCLPTPVLWRLQVSNGKKVGLIFSFTVGSFVCAMSVARLIAIRKIDPLDLPYTGLFPGMWSCVETNIGVVSACIPSLTPLFRYAMGQSPDGFGRATQLHSSQEITSKRGPISRRHNNTMMDHRSESLEGIVITSTIGIGISDSSGHELHDFR